MWFRKWKRIDIYLCLLEDQIVCDLRKGLWAASKPWRTSNLQILIHQKYCNGWIEFGMDWPIRTFPWTLKYVALNFPLIRILVVQKSFAGSAKECCKESSNRRAGKIGNWRRRREGKRRRRRRRERRSASRRRREGIEEERDKREERDKS